MRNYRVHSFGTWMCWLALSLMAVAPALAAEASGRKLEARLLWGTDDAKSPDPSHKPLDGTLAKKIKSMPLKYKNYFEVKRLTFAINDQDYTKVEMSKQCYIEIKDKGESKVAVKLYGEGKMVKRVDSPLPKGETIILGGDDKNGTVWLVVVTPYEPPKTK
ncbi:MAG: hypothetical protein NTW03_19095 [Verrucomicrobia bacterium]|nr:hypothetical protein [Verrucomicrobiota bacterium]